MVGLPQNNRAVPKSHELTFRNGSGTFHINNSHALMNANFLYSSKSSFTTLYSSIPFYYSPLVFPSSIAVFVRSAASASAA